MFILTQSRSNQLPCVRRDAAASVTYYLDSSLFLSFNFPFHFSASNLVRALSLFFSVLDSFYFSPARTTPSTHSLYFHSIYSSLLPSIYVLCLYQVDQQNRRWWRIHRKQHQKHLSFHLFHFIKLAPIYNHASFCRFYFFLLFIRHRFSRAASFSLSSSK